ncbi:Translin-associated factor X-interacting protein 1 [Fasciola gigantica]|uniref:Translin-associated factor X-interacting protein 1 n=1 Tax=Fasciola gigantica TaxID=46835 RepID=A0A504Y8X9_FASGI|nr:Translin-associated factor X-interacting protein 1 [Fasciola gigantica]
MLSKRPKNVPEIVMNEVDRWPSHAAGRSYASSSILVSNGRLIVLSEEETKIPNLIPKPKFLSYLEDRISKNLATVKSGDIEGRLQVFREAFSTILTTFKTYEPILTQIYREYEVAFNHYKLEIQKLRPAKVAFVLRIYMISQEYLWTIYQECDERILAMQKRERPELEELQHKISQLKCVISEQKEEQTMMQLEIEKLKESLEEEHARYRHESDARNLLITEINTMRNQYNEIEGVARQTQAIAKEAGDPTLLKIALENARKAQSKAEFELIRLKSEYVDIVPKKEYDALEQKYQDQWTLMEEYKTKFAEATSNLKTFEEQLAAVTAERDEYMSSIHQLNTVSTPRPDWNEVGRRLPCGENKWNEATQGMTSREKLNHLLHEMDAIGKETNPQPTSFSAKASLVSGHSDQNTDADADNAMEEFFEQVELA